MQEAGMPMLCAYVEYSCEYLCLE